MREMFEKMVKIVPEGEKGGAKITHFEVSKEDASFTRIRAFQHPGAYVPPGRYAKLKVDGELMMTDTQMEQRSNYGIVLEARGDVLIAGLGIGMVLVPVLKNPKVKNVLVVEKSQDVIDLVEPPIRRALSQRAAKKLTVLQADIFEWQPEKGRKWDVLYFDIWANICTDNLDEISKLHRKFARRKNKGGWMESWQQELLRHRRRQERQQPWY